jgi:putative alpha-1,2-mannosidase
VLRARFTIAVRREAPGDVYVHAAVLNGKPLARPFLSHRDLVAGDGLLEITLGPEPNTALWQ